MLSQDELDKLLEEGMDEGEDKKAPEDEGGQEAKASGGEEGEATEEVSWDDAFKEAAEGGDAAAKKALEEEVEAKEEGPPQKETPVEKAPQKQAEFKDFGKEGPQEGVEHPDLDFILDIPLDISVELGRTKLRIKDLLKLGQGSVVELNKLAGEPAEIYVNQKLMAKGEIVVVNEKFGVRLTEIISPSDRVKQLG